MDYKMVAMDIDGTITDKNLHIHPSAIKAIKKAIHKGMIITLSTGRMFPSAKAIADQLGIYHPLIVYNGAEIRCPKNKGFAFSQYLPSDICKQIVQLCKQNKLYLQTYEADFIIVEKITDETKIDPDLSYAPCIEAGDLSKYNLKPCPKMMIVASPEKTFKIENLLKYKFTDKINITKSKPYLIEIIHPSVSKANSLEILANKLNIRREEIIAIGDANNDIEMIKWAGLGVCVANGTEKLKNSADIVTKNEYSLGVQEVFDMLV